MGFRREDFLDPPEPVDFRDAVTGSIDWGQFVQDLIGRLLRDHEGYVNGISTEELARLYFNRTDFEACTVMGQAMQNVRRVLLLRGIFIKSTHYRWHIAADAGEKMEYIKNRTRGLIGAFRRTQAQLGVAASQHAEIAAHPLVEAFAAAEERFARLEESGVAPLQLPEGGSDE